MNERDHLDGAADAYACPTAVELGKAVSVSLGLDSVCSPHNMYQCSAGAFADGDHAAGDSSRAAPELKTTGNMNLGGSRVSPNGAGLMKDDFGEVCRGAQQVSCMDLLRSSDMDGAQTVVARAPVISRHVYRDANLFVNPASELRASSRLDQFTPLKPQCANPAQYRDPPSFWCADERAFGGHAEAERCGSGGHNLLSKYCHCEQTSAGSRGECYCGCYRKGEHGGKDSTRAAMAHGYGQLEKYQCAIPQDEATFSTVKTEPSLWVNCTDRRFR